MNIDVCIQVFFYTYIYLFLNDLSIFVNIIKKKERENKVYIGTGGYIRQDVSLGREGSSDIVSKVDAGTLDYR